MTRVVLLWGDRHELRRALADGGARAAARPAEGGVDPFRAQAHVIEALATALVERDRYTGEHSAICAETRADAAACAPAAATPFPR
jgi:hypothetical protein